MAQTHKNVKAVALSLKAVGWLYLCCSVIGRGMRQIFQYEPVEDGDCVLLAYFSLP